MSRYLIIDMEKVKADETLWAMFCHLEQYDSPSCVLSEEETLSKFKEVFEAGEKRHLDYNHCTEWGYDYNESLSWENFSKTL